MVSCRSCGPVYAASATPHGHGHGCGATQGGAGHCAGCCRRWPPGSRPVKRTLHHCSRGGGPRAAGQRRCPSSSSRCAAPGAAGGAAADNLAAAAAGHRRRGLRPRAWRCRRRRAAGQCCWARSACGADVADGRSCSSGTSSGAYGCPRHVCGSTYCCCTAAAPRSRCKASACAAGGSRARRARCAAVADRQVLLCSQRRSYALFCMVTLDISIGAQARHRGAVSASGERYSAPRMAHFGRACCCGQVLISGFVKSVCQQAACC